VCVDNMYTISHWTAYNHIILFIYLHLNQSKKVGKCNGYRARHRSKL